MSRGGFGGGRNNGGMMAGQKLPFEVDPTLEEEVAKYDADDATAGKTDKPGGFVWPEYPGGVPRAPPITKKEREIINIKREMIARHHASPLYTGPPGTLDQIRGIKRSAADFNAFEDQETYGKKFEKKPFKFADFTKYKWQAPHLFPKELWSTMGYNPDAVEDPSAPKKKLALNNTIMDKLARFDEDAEERGIADGEAKDGDDDAEGGDEDEEAEPEGPQDDDFDEDDEDEGDDYNAEQYFEGGEEDVEDGGPDDYAGDDGY